MTINPPALPVRLEKALQFMCLFFETGLTGFDRFFPFRKKGKKIQSLFEEDFLQITFPRHTLSSSRPGFGLERGAIGVFGV
jgi:hypothetical protein